MMFTVHERLHDKLQKKNCKVFKFKVLSDSLNAAWEQYTICKEVASKILNFRKRCLHLSYTRHFYYTPRSKKYTGHSMISKYWSNKPKTLMKIFLWRTKREHLRHIPQSMLNLAKEGQSFMAFPNIGIIDLLDCNHLCSYRT